MLFPRLLLRTSMTIRMQSLFGISFFLLMIALASAQPKAPVPTLTTDDVVGSKPFAPAPAGKTAAQDVASTTSVKTEDDPKKKAEKEWNDRLKKAQETLSELERRADQTDLRITQLRNQLSSATARAPEANGQLNIILGDLVKVRDRLRAEAQTARQEVTALEAEGQSHTYKVAEVSLTNEKGEPDTKAFQMEYSKLQNELRDAQARIEVLQIRLNKAQAEVLNRGNGDNFTLNRLRQERDNTSTELQETRSRIEELKNKIQTHRQKATAAGVPLSSQ